MVMKADKSTQRVVALTVVIILMLTELLGIHWCGDGMCALCVLPCTGTWGAPVDFGISSPIMFLPADLFAYLKKGSLTECEVHILATVV